jgi:hypothetical protein
MVRAGTRVGIATVCAALALGAGCARGGSSADELQETVPVPPEMKPCDEVFGADKVIDLVTFGEACTRGEEMVVSRPVRLECLDQRVLVWNEFAWGYEGSPMTMLDTGEAQEGRPMEEQLPYDEAITCLQGIAPEAPGGGGGGGAGSSDS